MSNKLLVSILVFFVLSSFAFAIVDFSFTNVTIEIGKSVEIPIDITNEDDVSVTFKAYITCKGCGETDNFYIDDTIILSVFNESLFSPLEHKVGILGINSQKGMLNNKNFTLLIYEGTQLVKNQSFLVSVVRSKKSSGFFSSIFDFFISISNKLFLFAFVMFFCYFGLKFFIRTGGPSISRELFFLLWLISAIILTLTLLYIFKL